MFSRRTPPRRLNFSDNGSHSGIGKPWIFTLLHGANLAYLKQAPWNGGFSGDSGFSFGRRPVFDDKIRKLYGGRSVIFSEWKRSHYSYCTMYWLKWFPEQRYGGVSKKQGYKDVTVITAGYWPLVFPSWSLPWHSSIFNPSILILSALLWFLKILAEYPLVRRMPDFLKRNICWVIISSPRSFSFSIPLRSLLPAVRYVFLERRSFRR